MTYCQTVPASDQWNILQPPTITRPAIYLGPAYSHFGHFLAESIGRLWAYRLMADADPLLVFVVPQRVPLMHGQQRFVAGVLRGFSIPLDRVMFVDNPVRIDRVAVPEQRYGFGFLALRK